MRKKTPKIAMLWLFPDRVLRLVYNSTYNSFQAQVGLHLRLYTSGDKK